MFHLMSYWKYLDVNWIRVRVRQSGMVFSSRKEEVVQQGVNRTLHTWKMLFKSFVSTLEIKPESSWLLKGRPHISGSGTPRTKCFSSFGGECTSATLTDSGCEFSEFIVYLWHADCVIQLCHILKILFYNYQNSRTKYLLKIETRNK